MNSPRFVHLRLHSEYSVVDGNVRLDDAVKAAAKDGMGALALTDLANAFGLVRFYKEARGKGVKPIVGADVWITNHDERDKPARLLLLVRSKQGYLNLCQLLARAWLSNQHRGRAEIAPEWFDEPGVDDAPLATGLLALSGGMGGDIGMALANGNEALARKLATNWSRVFPGAFYIELQRAGHAGTDDEVLGRLHLALFSGDGIELEQRAQAFVFLGARGTADEVGTLAGDKRIGRSSDDLELHIAVELREALVAIELRLIASEQAQEGRIEVASGHWFSSGYPAAATWLRSRRRASWSIL